MFPVHFCSLSKNDDFEYLNDLNAKKVNIKSDKKELKIKYLVTASSFLLHACTILAALFFLKNRS